MTSDEKQNSFSQLWGDYLLFERCFRSKGERLSTFLSHWRNKMAIAQSAGCQYSNNLLACKLLEKSNLNTDDVQNIITSIDWPSSDFFSALLAKLETLSPEESEPRDEVNRNQKQETISTLFVKEESASMLKTSIEPLFGIKKGFIEIRLDGQVFSQEVTRCPNCDSLQGLVLVNDQDERNEVMLYCNSCHKSLQISTVFEHEQELSDITHEELHDPDMEIKEETVEDPETLMDIDITSLYGKQKRSIEAKRGRPPKEDKENHSCNLCDKKYRYVVSLIKHMTKEHKANSNELSEYKAKLKKKANTKNRKEGLGVENRNPKSEFREEPKIKVPESRQKKAEQHQCEFCGKECPVLSRLKEHYSRCPNLDKEKREAYIRPYNKRVPCKICWKIFAGVSNLRLHMTTHGEKNFICDICSAAFSNAQYLSSHKKRHEGLKKHKCDICSKSFVEKTVLTRHVKQIHKNERPFQCDQCSYKTANKNHLFRHVMKHTGERPFKCGLCDKTYRFKKSVKAHIWTQHKQDNANGNIICLPSNKTPSFSNDSACLQQD